MKKLTCFLLLLCLLLSPVMVWAANTPVKNGTVQDQAGMFREEALASLEQAAQGPLYTFYILTIDSLQGEDPFDYTTRVFNEWGLQNNEILLLISSQDRRIEMNLVSEELQRSIRSFYGGGDVGELIGRLTEEYFIPAAKEGDFAQASLNLMNAVHELAAEDAEAVQPASVPDPEPEAPAADPEPQAGDMSPAETSADVDKKPLIPPLSQWNWTLIAIVLTSVVLAWILLYGMILKIQWSKLRSRANQLLIEVSHANEELKPYVGLVQGQTEKLVNQLNELVTLLLIDLGKLQQDMEAKILFIRLLALRQGIRKGRLTVANCQAVFEKIYPEIVRVGETERQVTRKVEDLSGKLEAAQSTVQRLAEKHSFPLTCMTEELTELEAELSRVRDLKVFDPLRASEAAAGLTQPMEKAFKEAEELPQWLNKYNAFPQTLSECRQELERWINEHCLKLVGIDPYSKLDEAQRNMEPLLAELRVGNMPSIRQISGRMDELLAEALEMTKRHAYLRGKNQEDIRFIKQKIAEFAKVEADLEQILSDLREAFVKEHWVDLAVSLEAAKRMMQDTAVQLPNVIKLTDDDHQHFEEARLKLDEMLQWLDGVDQISSHCQSISMQLNEAMDDLRTVVNESWKQFMESAQLARNEKLIFLEGAGPDETYPIIYPMFQKLKSMLHTTPYSLQELERHVREFSGRIDDFVIHVEFVLGEKNYALEAISFMESSFQSAVARTRRKIRVRKYEKNYRNILYEVNNLMASGFYMDAAEKVNEVQYLIDEMDNEYQRKLYSERTSASSSSWGSSSSETSIWGSSSSRKPSGSSIWGYGSSRNTSGSSTRDSSSSQNTSGGSSWSSTSSRNTSGGSTWGSSSSANKSGGSSWGSGSNNNNKSGGSNW